MALSDAQIDRFSRQIILPQIGAAGQQRLLQSSIAVAGSGALAETAVLYLAGAGTGRIALYGADRRALRAQLLDLNPELQVTVSPDGFGDAAADVLVACDLALPELDRAAASRRAIVAGGSDGDGGWIAVAGPDSCASCAARSWVPRSPARQGGDAGALLPTAAVVGSLMSLAALKLLLGLGEARARTWLQFEALRSTLTEHPLERAADCPRCAA